MNVVTPSFPDPQLNAAGATATPQARYPSTMTWLGQGLDVVRPIRGDCRASREFYVNVECALVPPALDRDGAVGEPAFE